MQVPLPGPATMYTSRRLSFEYPAISPFCGPMTGRAPDFQPQQPRLSCEKKIRTQNDRPRLILENLMNLCSVFCS